MPSGEAALTIEVARETDGRWYALIRVLPGVIAYGNSREEAIEHVKALALHTIADCIEHGEPGPEGFQPFVVAA
jgi:predicted RNase H-like HicB family nuclease